MSGVNICMAYVLPDLVTDHDIASLLDYMRINDDRTDIRLDVRSKHPRWSQDQWPQTLVQAILDKVMPYDYLVEEAIFNESKISFRLHADSGDGDVTRLGHAVLIPLLVEGPGATVFFNNHWHGPSTKFSRVDILPFEYDIPIGGGEVYHVEDLRQLLLDIDIGKTPSKLGEIDDLRTKVIDLIKARSGQKIGQPDGRTSDYQSITNYDDSRELDAVFWQQHLSHVPRQNFHGLAVEQVIDWKPGQVILFERTQLHAAAAGHDRKIGLTIFTQRRR